jgi:hypothetical protein
MVLLLSLACSPSQQQTPVKTSDIPLNNIPIPQPRIIPMRITVSARELNVRSQPSADSDIIAQLSWGDALDIYDRFPYPWFDPESGKTDYWYKLKVAGDEAGSSGKVGWVFGGYLEITRQALEATTLALAFRAVFPGGFFEKNDNHWDWRCYSKLRPQVYDLSAADVDGDGTPELLALVSWVENEESGIATRRVQLAVLTLAEGKLCALLPEEGLTESYYGNLRVSYRLVFLSANHNAILVEQFFTDSSSPIAKFTSAGDARLYLHYLGEFRQVWQGKDGSIWK